MRSWLLKSFFFGYPFLLLSFAVAVPLFMDGTGLPIWQQIVFVVVVVVCIWLILRAEIVLELTITKSEVRQRYISMLKTRNRIILLADVRALMLQKIYVRSRGYYFFLSMKDGSKKGLLSLPRFGMDPSEEETIKESLETWTGLKIEKYSL